MSSTLSRTLALALLAVALPTAAWAGAVIEAMSGDVRVGSSNQVLILARADQKLAAGTTVVTGAGAQAVLSFEDGQRVTLHQNTEFRIVDSQYVATQPLMDRQVFDLLRGAARFVTGAIGQRSRTAWALRSPQMTIGIRGTDFMVAITNQAFVAVSQGAVALSNGFATTVLGAGSVVSVASSSAAVVGISASSLPTAASGAFASLGGSIGAGGAATGAVAGTAGAAAGGVGIGTAAAIGAAAAAAAAASGSGDSKQTTTTHH